MKLLFVEDEKEKFKEILHYLEQIRELEEVDSVHSIMSAIKALHQVEYDVVLLDMSLPLYDSGVNDENNEFETFGGLYIFDEIERQGLNLIIIVITAFDVIGDGLKRVSLEELDNEMKTDYSKQYKGCILYDHSSLEWKDALKKWLERK